MARSRNIKPGFYKNEDLAECSIWARYIFPGLWMLADRKGLLEDRPKRIKCELLPFDSQDVEPLLNELQANGFIVRYKNEDGAFIWITAFCKHQSPHYTEKDSAIKPPILPESSGSSPAIKGGSKPPDSLIPDSLIPEESGGDGSPPAPPSSSKPKVTRARKTGEVTLAAFFAQCEERSEQPISETDAVWDFAAKAGIPNEFIELTWKEFKARHRDSQKRYRNWRQAFQNCVRDNWYRLWAFDDAMQCVLTSAGRQASKVHSQPRIPHESAASSDVSRWH